MPNALQAADHFLRISETEQGERARRAAAGALVLRAVERAGADGFGLRRAQREVEGLDRSAERSILQRLLTSVETGAAPGARVARTAVQYACELERTRRLPEADAAVRLALALDGASAVTALHAARVA